MIDTNSLLLFQSLKKKKIQSFKAIWKEDLFDIFFTKIHICAFLNSHVNKILKNNMNDYNQEIKELCDFHYYCCTHFVYSNVFE
jgi:hypothetical protein